MKNQIRSFSGISAVVMTLFMTMPVSAHDFRPAGKAVSVAKSVLIVTPSRDFNAMSIKQGKNVEIWSLDGERLNSITFFGGVSAGSPLYKERNKKREPLPKLRKDTLIAEIPELLEGTIRAYNQIANFNITGSEPSKFMGSDAISFTYNFVDKDELPRLGEAMGTIIDGKLYMVTVEAPRLHYFERVRNDFQAIVQSAKFK
jgi:hypothetical protein